MLPSPSTPVKSVSFPRGTLVVPPCALPTTPATWFTPANCKISRPLEQGAPWAPRKSNPTRCHCQTVILNYIDYEHPEKTALYKIPSDLFDDPQQLRALRNSKAFAEFQRVRTDASCSKKRLSPERLANLDPTGAYQRLTDLIRDKNSEVTAIEQPDQRTTDPFDKRETAVTIVTYCKAKLKSRVRVGLGGGVYEDKREEQQ